ncbi:LysR family transcriptional regulator [Marinobacterium rhizophilum]|uniref:LysR family transcriptional regulator n=1 Tax=Marinobacterium rhizophilum TaxID=420402 RepID=A0ABY5HDN1_9GAMM|nr:LysR family transcriptional regulator [Marinobacterium rhizophilum]UTW10441.1 LysR family transcriptional regulator [Marinobacterium rhizophilum]
MFATLDPVLLRSFVAVVESGSFTRAGERVHLSQSTVSQQVRRLEEQLGCSLLDRRGRHVRVSEQGQHLLGYARRLLSLMNEAVAQVQAGDHSGELRIGVAEDFAAERLTPTLAAFAKAHPNIRLEVSSDLSSRLWQQFSAGAFELVLIKQRQGQAAAQACWPEPLDWCDSAQAPSWQRDPLPLVMFPQGGLYRDEMIHALESAGRRWRISYLSASLVSLGAAVADGLGVSLLPRRLAHPGHLRLLPDQGFIAPASIELALHYQSPAPARVEDLAQRLIALCSR